jgi:hypothetical protein
MSGLARPSGAPASGQAASVQVQTHPVKVLKPSVSEAMYISVRIDRDFDVKAFQTPPAYFNDSAFSDAVDCF